MDEIVQFDFPTDSPKIIKVIGVGGGGGNAAEPHVPGRHT